MVRLDKLVRLCYTNNMKAAIDTLTNQNEVLRRKSVALQERIRHNLHVAQDYERMAKQTREEIKTLNEDLRTNATSIMEIEAALRKIQS
jgi:FtsZ-binding cell division protein ZapB